MFEGSFNTGIDEDEELRETEEERLKRLEDENKDLRDRKIVGWVKMIYYLTKGDITKTESVLKQSANWAFMMVGFEQSNKQWVKNVRSI